MLRAGAVVGALAAVLADAAAELRVDEDDGVVQHALRAQVVVERLQAVAERRHQVDVGALRSRPAFACVSKPPVCTQNTFVPICLFIAPATACSACAKPLFG